MFTNANSEKKTLNTNGFQREYGRMTFFLAPEQTTRFLDLWTDENRVEMQTQHHIDIRMAKEGNVLE